MAVLFWNQWRRKMRETVNVDLFEKTDANMDLAMMW